MTSGLDIIDPDEEQPHELISFKQIVSFHINECRKILYRVQSIEDVEIAQDAVNVLESLLAHLPDYKYKNELDELNKKYDDKISNLNAAEKSNPKIMARLKKNFAIDQFTILLGVASRGGLTIIRSVSDNV